MGHRSVREAQECISAQEFAEWMAFDRISPIGDVRGDWQAASIASVVANGLSAKDKQYEPEDFLLHFAEKTLASPKDVGSRTMAIFKRIKKSMEGKHGRDDR